METDYDRCYVRLQLFGRQETLENCGIIQKEIENSRKAKPNDDDHVRPDHRDPAHRAEIPQIDLKFFTPKKARTVYDAAN
jgi:hypothetical protein